MQQTDADTRTQARDVLAQAEGASGVKVKILQELGQMHELSTLFSRIWGTEGMISTELLRALGHAGNYVAGAFSNGDLLGGAVGFLGMQDGTYILHSHIVGVEAQAQGRNIGFTLKQHQRCWTLDRAITTMHWTFDPLVRRNAYFNFNKLGADAAAYYPTFYGEMTDGVNAGDESDRMLVSWDLAGERAVRGALAPASTEELLSRGAVVCLSERDDRPQTVGPTGEIRLCGTPSDIVKLRESDLAAGLEWRKALRGVLSTSLDEGFVVTGFTRDGFYVLEQR